MKQHIRVLIADDGARSRAGLQALLATWPEVEVMGEVSNGQAAVDFVVAGQPDVVLMDVQMPGMDGVEATRYIKTQWPMVKVIVLTMHRAYRSAALAAGADAFLTKGGPPDQLLATLRAISTGGGHSTP